jgi:hypothetical protein
MRIKPKACSRYFDREPHRASANVSLTDANFIQQPFADRPSDDKSVTLAASEKRAAALQQAS